MPLSLAIHLAVHLACTYEATARKPGNVHPGASFVDLRWEDFIASAAAIAPVLPRFAQEGVGVMVLEAIRATRKVVRTNTNLGIVLLLAPLVRADVLGVAVGDVLRESTVRDASLVYRAIRETTPGGMGKVEEQDVADEPTMTLLEAMRLAADRDTIARWYATDYAGLDDCLGWLADALERDRLCPERAIVRTQLTILAEIPDSLIERKCGRAVALEVMERAKGLSGADLRTSEGRSEVGKFDRWLRSYGKSRNPGTTADMITATLYVALRRGLLPGSLPFSCDTSE